MMEHAYAPSRCSAPDLYVRYSLVAGLHLDWEDVGGIDPEEIPLLVELVGMKNEADALRQRVANRGHQWH